MLAAFKGGVTTGQLASELSEPGFWTGVGLLGSTDESRLHRSMPGAHSTGHFNPVGLFFCRQVLNN